MMHRLKKAREKNDKEEIEKVENPFKNSFQQQEYLLQNKTLQFFKSTKFSNYHINIFYESLILCFPSYKKWALKFISFFIFNLLKTQIMRY